MCFWFGVFCCSACLGKACWSWGNWRMCKQGKTTGPSLLALSPNVVKCKVLLWSRKSFTHPLLSTFWPESEEQSWKQYVGTTIMLRWNQLYMWSLRILILVKVNWSLCCYLCQCLNGFSYFLCYYWVNYGCLWICFIPWKGLLKLYCF